jgi:hypothetical protein
MLDDRSGRERAALADARAVVGLVHGRMKGRAHAVVTLSVRRFKV